MRRNQKGKHGYNTLIANLLPNNRCGQGELTSIKKPVHRHLNIKERTPRQLPLKGLCSRNMHVLDSLRDAFNHISKLQLGTKHPWHSAVFIAQMS